ncbi:MAG: methylated-DNA--[protein]-cysteine S-methyltransferase [Arenicellales bacterium]
MTLSRFVHDSPIGPLTVVTDGDTIVMINFPDVEGRVALQTKKALKDETVTDGRPHAGTAAALDAYFTGDLHALDKLPIAPRGTNFEQSVWRELRRIPVGETRSYGDVAKAIGRPTATRAVGRANGINPIPLVVPCHRVIGADGSLTGFGGGLETKAWLLRHEGALLM